jgi:hypothetical protein
MRRDVPESRFAFLTENGRQVRYLVVHPDRWDPIKELELVKGPGDNTSPIFLALTAELAEGR